MESSWDFWSWDAYNEKFEVPCQRKGNPLTLMDSGSVGWHDRCLGHDGMVIELCNSRARFRSGFHQAYWCDLAY